MVSGNNNNGKPALRFEKDLNGRKVVIEYVSDKRNMLILQTMYAWENKNGNTPTATNAQGPLKTSETLSGIVPNTIVEDSNKKSNIRFQLKNPIEETENQVAAHNLKVMKRKRRN